MVLVAAMNSGVGDSNGIRDEDGGGNRDGMVMVLDVNLSLTVQTIMVLVMTMVTLALMGMVVILMVVAKDNVATVLHLLQLDQRNCSLGEFHSQPA